jgi:hypothetical protein
VGSGAEQKIRQLGIPIRSVCSPWLVVSMFRHGSLSNSLPLSFGDNVTMLSNLVIVLIKEEEFKETPLNLNVPQQLGKK